MFQAGHGGIQAVQRSRWNLLGPFNDDPSRGSATGTTVCPPIIPARSESRNNSPGGSAFGSELVRRELELTRQAGKPVVVSMGDLAASGGYWISMNADRIYADASTITGSIGIFGMVPNFSRALDKIGVHTDGVGTAKYAGAFDITRPLDPGVAAAAGVGRCPAAGALTVCGASLQTPQKARTGIDRRWARALAVTRS